MQNYQSYKDGANRDIREVLREQGSSSQSKNTRSNFNLKRSTSSGPSSAPRNTNHQACFYNHGNRSQKENQASSSLNSSPSVPPRRNFYNHTPRQNIHNGYKSQDSTILQFAVPKNPQTELFEQLNALDPILDYDRRVEIRNELLEMGATVSNPGTRPQTVIDIGSQFETFSSLAGRTPQRPLFRPKTTPARSTIASTLVGTDGARYYDGSSTDSSSTEINAFSEDELDDEDHDGMNYHLILHQNRANENDQDDPLVQETPPALLLITPSDQVQANGETSIEWQRFKVELERTKELVDRIPKPENDRTLHPDTEKLGYNGQKEFIRLGNDLLIKAPNYNRLLAPHIQNIREIVQCCRVNQLQVPYFKARNALFIRDEQVGNFRHYFIDRPHDLVLTGVIGIINSYRHKHHRDRLNDAQRSYETGIQKGPTHFAPTDSRGQRISTFEIKAMNSHDHVKKMLNSGKENVSPAIQNELLKKITDGLNRDNKDADAAENDDTAPGSNLGTLLEALENPDGYELNASDSSYLQGWKHALMAIQGGFKNLNLQAGRQTEVNKQPKCSGNRFLN